MDSILVRRFSKVCFCHTILTFIFMKCRYQVNLSVRRMLSLICCFFSRFNVIGEKSKLTVQTDNATRKSLGHITWVRALDIISCTECPPTCTKSNPKLNQTRGVETVGSGKFLCNLYTERTNRRNKKTTIARGNLLDILIWLVKALGIILYKEDPPCLYKIDSTLESGK
jgi:hypothetical protein